MGPMLVPRSAVNLLVIRALGGMLSGRYKSRYIGALSRDASYELTNRLSQDQNICLTTEFIEAVWQFTGGYPYSIHSLQKRPKTGARNIEAYSVE